MTKRALIRGGALAGLAIVVVAGCGGQQFPEGAAAPSTAVPYSTAVPHSTAVPRSTAVPAANGQSPRARLLASVERANAEKTARVEMTMTVTGDEMLTVTGTGVVDLAGGQMSMSLKGTANGRPVSLDARLVGNTIYSRTEKDWLSEPVDDQNEFTPNPAGYLEYLQGASDDVHEIGPVVLRGAATTEYGANIDLNLARAHARTSEQRSLFSHALELFGAVKMPAKVWIDTEGRLRKMQVQLDLTPALRRAGQHVTGHPNIVVTTEFFDFGVPVHVVAPPGAIDQVAIVQIRVAQSHLRNALVAEKVQYVDQQVYSADPALLKQIEPTLDWGRKLTVVVGRAGPTAAAVVCLSEPSASGAVFSLADVAAGPNAGTYYGRGGCPPVVDDVSVSRLGSRW